MQTSTVPFTYADSSDSGQWNSMPKKNKNKYIDTVIDDLSQKSRKRQRDEEVSTNKRLRIEKEETFNQQEPEIRVSRHQDIHRRMQKNRDAARIQQEQQVRQEFKTECDFSANLFHGHPVINEKMDEIDREVSAASCQGKRKTMEDAIEVTLISFTVGNVEYRAELLAVFDGHGGTQASAFVKEKIKSYLKESLEINNSETLTDEGIWDALKEVCKKLDADLPHPSAGTTAAIAMILETKIWVANVGDSRIVLAKDGKATQATEDAKPDIERYKKKIEDLGGTVTRHRVNGRLAVARAIGDKNVVGEKTKNCCVLPNPKITFFSLPDFKGGYLVIGCDGLFEVLSSNEVGESVQYIHEEEIDTKHMATILAKYALHKGTNDNVSVVVAQL